MDIYDVIIIGAGPGGLECAHSLEGSALSVLLIERNTIIGPKPCGGGITTAEKIVDAPAAICKILDKETFYVGKKKITVDIKSARKIFDREAFGQHQLAKIRDKNVTVITGENVTKVLNDRIITNKGEYKFRYLVGADGSNSIVRRYLKLPVKLCQGIYYEVLGEFDELVSYYNPSTISSGYIWEFPHLSHNNVGVYFDPLYLSPQEAKKRLDEYMNEKGYPISSSKYAGGIVNYHYAGHQFNNIFLIGDAGGFTSRLHGGGINNAMTSGRDVANTILNPNYKQIGVLNILREKRKEDLLLNFFYKNKWIQYPALNFILLLLRFKII